MKKIEDALGKVDSIAASVGKVATFIYTKFHGIEEYVEEIKDFLKQAGVTLKAEIAGSRPNAPGMICSG